MKVSLFAVVAILAAIPLVGCQENAPTAQAIHAAAPAHDYSSLRGTWSGQVLDASDKVTALMEWTVGQNGEFTGMMGPESSEGSSVPQAIPIQGTMNESGSVTGIMTLGDKEGQMNGTVLRSDDKITGKMIMRFGGGSNSSTAMKIRLERKSE